MYMYMYNTKKASSVITLIIASFMTGTYDRQACSPMAEAIRLLRA